ncbi:MAG: serine O-acetyltransferase [Chloroflexota bacterium]
MENINNSSLPTPLNKRLQDQSLKNIFQLIKEDIRTALERDPAARSVFEVFTSYAGLHAVWSYRAAHWLWIHKRYLLARWLSQFTRNRTGIEIHPGAKIGRRLFIDHGMGVVIGETAEFGNDVTLYHGVTLGGVSLEKGKRHPTIEDGVVVGASAKILGAITIGKGSRIGANAVVVKPVPSYSVVVGVPGQIIQRYEKHLDNQPDLDHGNLPDAIQECLQDIMARVDKLEAKLDLRDHPIPALQLTEDGTWHCQTEK